MGEENSFQKHLKEAADRLRHGKEKEKETITTEEEDSYEMACKAGGIPIEVKKYSPFYATSHPSIHSFYASLNSKRREELIRRQPSFVLNLTEEDPKIKELAARQGLSPRQYVANVQKVELALRKYLR